MQALLAKIAMSDASQGPGTMRTETIRVVEGFLNASLVRWLVAACAAMTAGRLILRAVTPGVKNWWAVMARTSSGHPSMGRSEMSTVKGCWEPVGPGAGEAGSASILSWTEAREVGEGSGPIVTIGRTVIGAALPVAGLTAMLNVTQRPGNTDVLDVPSTRGRET
jgi:hypothetical protein